MNDAKLDPVQGCALIATLIILGYIAYLFFTA